MSRQDAAPTGEGIRVLLVRYPKGTSSREQMEAFSYNHTASQWE